MPKSKLQMTNECQMKNVQKATEGNLSIFFLSVKEEEQACPEYIEGNLVLNIISVDGSVI